MSKFGKITRRSLLVSSVAVTGGVAFGYYKYKKPYENPLKADALEDEVVITPYIRIDQSGVTVITPRAEMGQGVHSTLAAMVAEELDISWQDIRVEHGPASRAYYNGAILEDGVPFAATDASFMANAVRDFTHIPTKLLGMQITGGSTSTPDGFEKMRIAGAAAREVLIAAAAAKLDVSPSSLSTENGFVVSGDKRLPYVDLAVDAQKFDPPTSPLLKDKNSWKLLGKSLPRVDMIEKCTGTALFSLDVRLPHMRYATVKMNPHLGGEMIAFDASKAEKMPGVEKIVSLDSKGIAVVASNTWYALNAAKAITFDWDKADFPIDTHGMFAVASSSFHNKSPDSEFREEGDVESVFAEFPDQIFEAEYRVPYLAHATMEPMNAVAFLSGGVLNVWAGSQNPTQILKEGESITGLPRENIRVHTTYMGGGFGRRTEMDFIKYAITIAKLMEGIPIKTTWSREEDMTHDVYRPLAIARFSAVVGGGKPRAVDLKIAAQSIRVSQMGRLGLTFPGADSSIVQAAWDQPYDIENFNVTGYRVPELLPVGSWRSVGASQNGFFHESMIDELAHRAGVDPMTFRLQLVTHGPSRKVLDAAAQLSEWGRELPPNHGLGVAFTLSFGVPTAEVIEIANTEDGIKIVKVYAVVDVGTALDPRNIEAQVISGINFGLSAAMMGEITVKDGKVEQTNFHDYDAIRMYQAPDIKVKILENGEKIRGIGEPGTPPAAPALGNAIFAATGQRIRELPFNKHIAFV